MTGFYITKYLLLFFLLASCGSKSVEGFGHEIGDKSCECNNIDWSFELEKSNAIIDIMKADPTTDLTNASEQVEQLQSEADQEELSKRNKACEDELKDLTNRALVAVPKNEDRKTLSNLAEALGRQCRDQHQTEQEELQKELDEFREKMKARNQ